MPFDTIATLAALSHDALHIQEALERLADDEAGALYRADPHSAHYERLSESLSAILDAAEALQLATSRLSVARGA